MEVCFCILFIQAYLRQLKTDLRLYKEFLRLSNRLSCRWGRRGGSHTRVKEKIKQHNNNNNLAVSYISQASSPVDIHNIKVGESGVVLPRKRGSRAGCWLARAAVATRQPS